MRLSIRLIPPQPLLGRGTIHRRVNGGGVLTPRQLPLHRLRRFPSPQNRGEEILARAARPHPLGTVRSPSARRRLGGVPAGADRPKQAAAVGAGPDGDPRSGADLSAGVAANRPHPRHRAGCPLGAVGDGGGVKVRRAVGRDRRAVGRPGEPRFHRDPAAGGRGGAVGSTGLAGAARRKRRFERRSDALASRQPAEPSPSVRPARSRRSGVGCRAVPRPRASARAMEHRP